MIVIKAKAAVEIIEHHNAVVWGRSGAPAERRSQPQATTPPCYALTRLHASTSITFNFGQFSVPAIDTRYGQL